MLGNPGVKILLIGPTGTGKTTSLGTIADADIELFVIFTERGEESLVGYWADRGLPVPPNVHWHTILPKSSPVVNLHDMAGKINSMTYEQLSKVQDPNRIKENQYMDVLWTLKDFPDDRDGKKYGDVTEWGPERCLAIDSLSGLNELVLSLVVGNKPVRAQNEWGVAQNTEMGLLRLLTSGTRLTFVLTGHVDRLVDEVLGGVKLMVKTPGKAMSPDIPRLFSDVILSVRNGKIFSWSTADPKADLKTRNLPIADNLPPSFEPIIEKWRKRNASI